MLTRTKRLFTKPLSTSHEAPNGSPPAAYAASATTAEEAALRRAYGLRRKDIQTLMNVGFTKDQAVQALIQCDNNVEVAANILIGGNGPRV